MVANLIDVKRGLQSFFFGRSNRRIDVGTETTFLYHGAKQNMDVSDSHTTSKVIYDLIKRSKALELKLVPVHKMFFYLQKSDNLTSKENKGNPGTSRECAGTIVRIENLGTLFPQILFP